jgi:hypothetical protein
VWKESIQRLVIAAQVGMQHRCDRAWSGFFWHAHRLQCAATLRGRRPPVACGHEHSMQLDGILGCGGTGVSKEAMDEKARA